MAKAQQKKIVIVRRKKGHGGGHHGGSWKVAYADFVTAMMAFFLVMWILGMDENARNAVEGYFSNPVGYKKGYSSGSSPISVGTSPSAVQAPRSVRLIMRASESETLEQAGANIQQRVQRELGSRSMSMLVEVIVTEQGLRIELIEQEDGETFFAFGSAELKPLARTILGVIGEELGQLRNSVVLEGHTDSAPFSTPGYTNWELSADRANAARRTIQAAGVDPGRVVEIRGYGATRLRVPERPLDPANRRISILLPFTTPSPEENVDDLAVEAASGAETAMVAAASI